ncbi:hypothetical protein CFK37_04180 [Virgibacillus phasianinus]|uniref:Uncharacterized protein n=1 Tax=Virgibacillus phasianinus TaxID=2017483 RepID=A0A220TZZ6_9BACI|nr:VanW family protein [Virgibacillus phasianinus]ASK61428.1 hypothetical protein CFK37_04180 [Virgibacillus phasianinus]
MHSILLSLYLFMMPIEHVPYQLTVTDHGDIIETVELDQYDLEYFQSLFINQARLGRLITQLNDKVYKEPTNATLDGKGAIVQEKSGIALDRRKFQKLFHESFYLGQPVKMEVPTKRVYPRVDSELLAEIKEKEIGHYVTLYKESNKERTHNINLAAKAINNHVVFPGETFSFNKVVGKRTKEKGYKKAPVIVKGELSEDIGGGICQVSSTLFNAVNLKGVQIVERYSHSRSVPYVPPGRDATVSWWGPDFSFKNMFNQPILIRAKSVNGRMDIGIYSSDAVERHRDT